MTRRARALLPALAALAGCLLALLAAAAPASAGPVHPRPRAVLMTAAPLAVRVVGNALVDGAGRTLRLHGVNRSGTEFACAQGWGVFDGPTDDASIAAMRSWAVNAVRVPLNESCWLGLGGVDPRYGGPAYRDAVAAYVARLHAAGLVVVLDLHWNAPGSQRATSQQVMADADHGPAFWTSVATRFRSDPAVVFDLYNEPHDISWSCWRDGCTTPDGWRTAGMQSLLDAVRTTGARQPVLAGGGTWAGDLSQWLRFRPVDPAGQLAASAHIYSFSECATEACWDASIGAVAAQFPVVAGETGSDDCGTGFLDRYMAWADAHGVSYTGWTWNTWDCRTGPALITSYDGTPSGLGVALRRHLLALAADPLPTPTPTPVVVPPPPAPVPGHAVYDFERGTAPWRAETPGVAVAPSATAHTGSSALQVSAPATTGTSVLRLNDGGDALDPAAGSRLTAWVQVPADAPGTGWCAQLELQDTAWRWHGGTCAALVPGVWTRVELAPDPALWAGRRALGLQVSSAQSGSSPLRVLVDDVAQG